MQYLSKYRTELMGFAILLILFYHSKIYIPNVLFPVRLIKSIGYIGVDIFFLLSGIGIAYSLYNNSTKKIFFLKRFKRIIPIFWIILIIYFFIQYIEYNFNAKNMFLSFLGLDFIVLGNLKFWFIPAIFISYLIAPFFYSLIAKYKTSITLTFTIIFIFLLFAIALYLAPHLLIFIIRLPIFLFGIYIGYNLKHKKSIPLIDSFMFNIIVFSISAITFIFLLTVDAKLRWSLGLWWYPSIFIAYPICFFIGHILNHYDNSKYFSTISNLFKIIGTLSLELYLIHSLILYSTEDFTIDLPSVFLQATYIILSFIFALFIKYLFRKIHLS